MSPRTPDTPPESQSDTPELQRNAQTDLPNDAQTDTQTDPPRNDERPEPDRQAQESSLVVRERYQREVAAFEESSEDDALMLVFTGP